MSAVTKRGGPGWAWLQVWSGAVWCGAWCMMGSIDNRGVERRRESLTNGFGGSGLEKPFRFLALSIHPACRLLVACLLGSASSWLALVVAFGRSGDEPLGKEPLNWKSQQHRHEKPR